MRSSIFAVLCLILGALPGCGGGSSGGGNVTTQCPAFTACGGNIVGTWKLVSSCIENPDTSASSGIPGCSIQYASMDYRYDGTIGFSGGGTYELSIGMGGHADLAYTSDCFSPSTSSCASLDEALRSSSGQESGGTGSCTSTSGGDCTCSLNLDMTFTETGTYTVSGNSITMTSSTNSSNGVDLFEYCVQGSKLALQHTDPRNGGTAGLFLTK